LIRINAISAVSATFPRFAAHRGESNLADDIDAFVSTFGAIEPQFMHLASEFVRFVHDRNYDTVSQVLVEYEWVLFAVEIAEEKVIAFDPHHNCRSFQEIQLNPTTRLIASPFVLSATNEEAESMVLEDHSPFVYAVFRTSDHRVMTVPLNAMDIEILQAVQESKVHTDHDDSFARINIALQSELLTIHHRNHNH
jgi:hypothetical protein